MSDAFKQRYLDEIGRSTRTVDTRIVLQMQRIVEPKVEEVFVPLTFLQIQSEPERAFVLGNSPLSGLDKLSGVAADERRVQARSQGLPPGLSSRQQSVA